MFKKKLNFKKFNIKDESRMQDPNFITILRKIREEHKKTFSIIENFCEESLQAIGEIRDDESESAYHSKFFMKQKVY